jgi:hypothetical protein
MKATINGVECEAMEIDGGPEKRMQFVDTILALGGSGNPCFVCPNDTRPTPGVCGACPPEHVWVPVTLAPIFKLRSAS